MSGEGSRACFVLEAFLCGFFPVYLIVGVLVPFFFYFCEVLFFWLNWVFIVCLGFLNKRAPSTSL